MGKYLYDVCLDSLLSQIEEARRALLVLDATPGKVASYKAKQKRLALGRLMGSVQARMAWHAGEIAKGERAGFAAGPTGEPKKRSIVRVGGAAHA